MKKIILLMLCFALLISIFAGCGSTKEGVSSEAKTEAAKSATTEKATEQTAEAKPVTLKILKAETASAPQWDELAAEYKKQFPNVTLDIESQDNDYWTVLKTRLNAGDYPDIFVTMPFSDTKTYEKYSADLTNEPFISNLQQASLAGGSLNGKILGVSLYVDNIGLIYNKKMFADAGITELPKTLSQLEEACKKLQAKGYTPFSNGYKEFWVIKHCLIHYMANEEGDPAAIAEGLTNGTKKFADLPFTSKFFDFIDLSLKYGAPKPLETGFSDQVNAIGAGKAAMTDQGNWAEDGIIQIDPNIEMGFLPIPVLEDPSKSGLMVGPAWTYKVTQQGKNIDASKALLNWIITSDYGKNWIPAILGKNSTIKGSAPAKGQLNAEAQKFVDANNTLNMVQYYWASGFEQQLGAAYQKYIAKKTTREQCLQELDAAWAKLSKAAE